MKERIVVIGAGGHGKVVADAIHAQSKYELIGFVDQTLSVGQEIINGFKVIEKQEHLHLLKDRADVFIVAVGNNVIREKVYQKAIQVLRPAIILHPSVIIGSDVKVGNGTVVLAHTVISTSSVIGDNTIVNSGTVVDHDCIIGNHVHLSIGTMVGSNSKLADGHTTQIGDRIESFSIITNSDN